MNEILDESIKKEITGVIKRSNGHYCYLSSCQEEGSGVLNIVDHNYQNRESIVIPLELRAAYLDFAYSVIRDREWIGEPTKFSLQISETWFDFKPTQRMTLEEITLLIDSMGFCFIETHPILNDEKYASLRKYLTKREN